MFLITCTVFLVGLLGCSQVVLSSPIQARTTAARPSVTISGATVVGTQTSPPTGGPIANRYLGIPYAQPPVRFAAPEAASPFKGTYDATQWKPSCIQQSTNSLGTTFPTLAETLQTSEDCLYLNIFTPTWANSSSGLPVMFWIHGGNLQYGSPALAIYDGNSFAVNQHVILVSISYRMSVFGFVQSPELPSTERNPGFLDQRLALEWAQQHIRAFGGDPSQVTIFGQSAGGHSVKNLITVPPNPLTFRAGIMESQGALLPVDGWNALVAALGCTDHPSQLQCVRGVDAATIMNISLAAELFFADTADNVTSRNNHELAFAEGTAARVPFIIGTNGLEFSYIQDPSLASLKNLTTQVLGASVTVTNLINGLIDQVDDNSLSAVDAAEKVLSDAGETCPTSILVSYAADHGYAAYRYLYNATFPNTSMFKGQGPYHTAEIPEVFGTYPAAGATTQQIRLSSWMQSTWANFAKQPSQGPSGWPTVQYTPNYLQLIGNGGSSSGTLINPSSRVDNLCPLLDPVLLLTGLNL